MYRLFPPSRHRCIRRYSSPWIMAVLMHYSNIHKSQIQCLHGRTTWYNQRMQQSISECTTRLIWKQMGYSSRILHRIQLLLAKDRKLRLQLKWEQQKIGKMLLGFMSQFQLQNSDGSELGSVMLGIHFGSHSIKWALFTFNFISSDSDKHLGYLHIVCT